MDWGNIIGIASIFISALAVVIVTFLPVGPGSRSITDLKRYKPPKK